MDMVLLKKYSVGMQISLPSRMQVKKCQWTLLIVLPWTVLIGCDAVGVFYTKDPQHKLGNAEVMQQSDRPLAADLFIHQAMEIYKQRNDEAGLAMSYKAYAFFLNNP